MAGHQVGVVDGLHHSSTLTIRDNVKWSDGQTMTADDVAYTFQLLKEHHGAQTRTRCRTTTITASGNKVDRDVRRLAVRQPAKMLTRFDRPQAQWSTISDPTTDT